MADGHIEVGIKLTAGMSEREDKGKKEAYSSESVEIRTNGPGCCVKLVCFVCEEFPASD